MEGLFLILCALILILVIQIRSRLSSNQKSTLEKFDYLESELRRLRNLIENKISVTEKPTTETVKPPSVEIKKQVILPPKPIVIEETEPFVPKPTPRLEEIEKNIFTKTDIKEPVSTERKPGFFERNPDLEKFIGENLANKIGIAILVLGIGFFVKYAIDQNWINEIGRVMIGILCGGILLGVAHSLRKKFHAFSSVLVGGGIAILYITITIAFQEYQIFNQVTAFIIMIVITGFTILLSLGYNRIELAVLAILGGYGSPFMVSTGSGNYVVLFIYILILNIGMLVLAYNKKWNLVNIISYIFTVILFAGWLGSEFDGQRPSMIFGALTFSTLFYLTFFAMNIIHNIKEIRPFKYMEFTLLLSNTFFYYSAGMYALSFDTGYLYRGLFTISLAIFNFVFVFLLYKNQKVDRNLVYLLIGLVLSFVSLAAPVQLEGNYITVFWAVEGVLLLWLSQKSGIQLMKIAAIIINGLMLISLIMDWSAIYEAQYDTSLTVIFNKAYVTGLFCFCSLLATQFLLRFEKDLPTNTATVSNLIISFILIIIGYVFNYLELSYQLKSFDIQYPAAQIIIGTYNILFILIIQLLNRFIDLLVKYKPVFASLGPLAIIIYLTVHLAIIDSRNSYLSDVAHSGFFFHYILVAILLVVTIQSIQAFRKLKDFNKKTFYAYSWVFIAFYIFLVSHELDHVVALSFLSEESSVAMLLRQNHKIGWPILWGVGAFIIMFIGMRFKQRHIRIISLVLLLITLLKLFFNDLNGISEGGKIAAFISLGILLLIISFMYQRLKKLLLDEDVATTSDQTD